MQKIWDTVDEMLRKIELKKVILETVVKDGYDKLISQWSLKSTEKCVHKINKYQEYEDR